MLSLISRCIQAVQPNHIKGGAYFGPCKKNRNSWSEIWSHGVDSRTSPSLMFSSKAYDGDGKTTVTILNEEIEFGLMINKFSNFGFKLNIGLNVAGPVALFPKTLFCWNIADPDQISPDSLILFLILNPKPDVLILGTGIKAVRLNSKAAQILKSNRIAYEVLPTEQACSAFNFLSSERRMVAAGLIPPTNVPLETMQFKKMRERTAILKDDLT